MKRPAESDFNSHVAYTRALEEYCDRKWVGLSTEDILILLDEHNLYGSKLVELIRATESKVKSNNV